MSFCDGPESEGEALLPLSALQHYAFCPRQCALIHVERMWADNRLTAEGHVAHERVDEQRTETRRGVRTVTAMPLRSDALGLTGQADVVEFHAGEGGEVPFPVEHKSGRPKAHDADAVQLCGQALCLEEMLDVTVPAGALFSGRHRRRRDVAFDADLRARTAEVARAAHALIAAGETPPPAYVKKVCDACSLIETCQPRVMGGGDVAAWLRRATGG